MCSDTLPKYFIKTTEILPLADSGLTTAEEFRNAEDQLKHQEWLKKAGLTDEEILLYNGDKCALPDRHCKIESSVLKSKLECIKNKLRNFQHYPGSSEKGDESISCNNLLKEGHRSIKFYPEGHPMHNITELEENLFGHLKDDRLPITKRRKILRRLERKKERIFTKTIPTPNTIDLDSQPTVNRSGSLWDVEVMPPKTTDTQMPLRKQGSKDCLIGPKEQTMYTIKDNKVVRLEPFNNKGEYKAVDIVMPVNSAEVQLLQGTKMSLDNIKKIDRFKDYDPGIPSKILYLKNIAPSLTQDSLSSLFKRFVQDNGGSIDVKLMSGRMRGQAFVAFQNEAIAVQALEEVNGTILNGRPIIIQFGKNSNRIQTDNNR